MKFIFTTFLSFTWFAITNAQTVSNNSVQKPSLPAYSTVQANPAVSLESTVNIKGDVIALTETEFDFGKIPQGKPVTHEFVITNTGNKPIVLDNVQASCGCTTPEWSKDAINPGASSKITVGYNAAADGPFTKSITLSYNGDKTREILIKGDVWKTPEASAPENSALNILKNQ